MRRALQSNGYTVLIATTADQAYRLMYGCQPHIVVLHADFCNGEGFAFCQEIKADDSLGFVPLIVLSEPDPEWQASPVQDLADALLIKPIELDELLAWLHFLLRIKRRFDRMLDEQQRFMAARQDVELLKSDIIGTVSHELRTPLVQVKAAIALLAEDVNDGGDTQQVAMARMATEAIGRLEGVVENIRQLAQTHNIRFSPVVVKEAIELASRHLERNWQSKGAHNRVQVRLSDYLPLVQGDKRAIARLLQLLIDNALKFSPEDKPVRVLAHPLDEHTVWIGVRDQGIGIPEEEHDRIFDAFYQVDGSVTRRYGGTGTGLALATLLANGMNTQIHVDSIPGKGSTFWFTLPSLDLDDL